MPLQRCQSNGKPGWKWGGSGKCYTYSLGNSNSEKVAKARAIRQGLAIGEGTLQEKKGSWPSKKQMSATRGDFGDWCKSQGFKQGVCQACINKAAKVGGHPAKMALFAVNVSKGTYHWPKTRDQKEQKGGATTLRTEDVLESFSFSQPDMQVDEEEGTIRDVAILGAISENGWEYSDQALQDVVDLLEGGALYCEHPAIEEVDQPRPFRDLIGKTVNLRKEGKRVKGDLHLVDMVEKICRTAKRAPELVGCSVNIRARVRARNGETDIVERVILGRSTDLVVGPATNRSLFEQRHTAVVRELDSNQGRGDQDEMEMKDLSVEVLEQKRPDLVQSITERALQSSEEAQKVDSLQAKVKSLTEQLTEKESKIAQLEAADRLRSHMGLVERLIQESKLPEGAVTDALKKSLIATEKEEDIKEILDGLRKVVGLEEPEAGESDHMKDIRDQRKPQAFASKEEREGELSELKDSLTSA